MPTLVSVQINTRPDWFSQDDSRRAYWESCTGFSGYTCSKRQDVGSVMLHELGHTIGLAHPSHVASSGHGGNAMTLAKCAVVKDQATICQGHDAAGSGVHRTHRRTLDGWDITSIQYHY